MNPQTEEKFATVEAMLRLFRERNVPDDELLVGWVGDGPQLQSPRDDLVYDPVFVRATRPLVADGGSTRVGTPDAGLLITV